MPDAEYGLVSPGHTSNSATASHLQRDDNCKKTCRADPGHWPLWLPAPFHTARSTLLQPVDEMQLLAPAGKGGVFSGSLLSQGRSFKMALPVT
jgi:hypothetical protein